MDLLKISGQTLSTQDCIATLKESNQIGDVILNIVREYLINQALKNTEFTPENGTTEQAIIDFRIRNELINADSLDAWLSENSLSYEEFRAKVEKGLKYDHLRQAIAGNRVDEFFAKNKAQFDRYSLSRLVVADETLAGQLRETIEHAPSQFPTLVNEHSISYDRELDGRMGVFPREHIPEQLYPYLDDVNEGSVIGPVVVDEHHCIFLIDKIFPAELNDGLRAELTERLFEEWMQEKIQNLDIQLLV